MEYDSLDFLLCSWRTSAKSHCARPEEGSRVPVPFRPASTLALHHRTRDVLMLRGTRNASCDLSWSISRPRWGSVDARCGSGRCTCTGTPLCRPSISRASIETHHPRRRMCSGWRRERPNRSPPRHALYDQRGRGRCSTCCSRHSFLMTWRHRNVADKVTMRGG